MTWNPAADSSDVVFPDPISAQPATKNVAAAAAKMRMTCSLGFWIFIFCWISCSELKVALVGVDATISLAFRHLVLNNANDGHEDGTARHVAADCTADCFNDEANDVHRFGFLFVRACSIETVRERDPGENRDTQQLHCIALAGADAYLT
jgi:hypothetical protein